MDRTVALLNIEHFRKRLSEETNESRRRELLQAMAEEEAKLARLTELPGEKTGISQR